MPARAIAFEVGYVAHPGERTVHTKPIPYGGGAAMFLGFLVAVLAAAARPASCATSSRTRPRCSAWCWPPARCSPSGLIDDVRDMSAPAKMAGQVLAASILYFFGVTMYELKIPLAGFFVLTPGHHPAHHGGLGHRADQRGQPDRRPRRPGRRRRRDRRRRAGHLRLRLMGLGLLPTDNIGPLVAVIACGICLGFLPFNFNPARIFMGDAGAHFLGLLMAASTMVIGGRVPTAVPISGVTYFFFAPLFIPLFILGVPLVDMAFAFVRRTARGQGLRHARTRSTSTTAWCVSVTAPGAASSSCGPGRRCSRASCSSRSSCTR